MKKLFTLVLVLLVATTGYSQVRKVSKSDAKSNPATMQMSKGMESFENVQSEPNMTRTDGELDYTTYDWQTNAAARTWTIQWPDNKVNFAFTCATDNSFTDRGTAIGTYDYDNDQWIPSGGRVESEKTGFGSIARYKENGIVVAAHTATMCGVYIVEDKDNITPNSAAATSYLDPTYDPSWPNVMTSGANRDIIHVVVTANAADGASTSVPGAEGVNNPIIYFRSMDGGQTWDKQNVVLPYMGSEYGLDWGSNVCYWMETTEDLSTTGSCIPVGPPLSGVLTANSALPTNSTAALANLVLAVTILASVVSPSGARTCLTMASHCLNGAATRPTRSPWLQASPSSWTPLTSTKTSTPPGGYGTMLLTRCGMNTWATSPL